MCCSLFPYRDVCLAEVEVAPKYSSECLEIAPQSLDGGERSKRCSFGAQDARSEPDRLESSRLRELNFNRGKSSFRTDQQHHLRGCRQRLQLHVCRRR